MFDFETRRKQLEVSRFVRRIVDNSSPNLPPYDGEARADSRSNRTIPVLLTPVADGQPIVGESVYAVTKDFSSQGAALVLCQPLQHNLVVVGFVLDGTPGFALGEVRQNVPIGGGFWQLGVQLVELITAEQCESLHDLVQHVERLVPQANGAAASVDVIA